MLNVISNPKSWEMDSQDSSSTNWRIARPSHRPRPWRKPKADDDLDTRNVNQILDYSTSKGGKTRLLPTPMSSIMSFNYLWSADQLICIMWAAFTFPASSKRGKTCEQVVRYIRIMETRNNVPPLNPSKRSAPEFFLKRRWRLLVEEWRV